jgi:hypothetical protein
MWQVNESDFDHGMRIFQSPNITIKKINVLKSNDSAAVTRPYSYVPYAKITRLCARMKMHRDLKSSQSPAIDETLIMIGELGLTTLVLHGRFCSRRLGY